SGVIVATQPQPHGPILDGPRSLSFDLLTTRLDFDPIDTRLAFTMLDGDFMFRVRMIQGEVRTLRVTLLGAGDVPQDYTGFESLTFSAWPVLDPKTPII